ncbi:hypothetical protein NM96060_2228 [Neisseria meningitidis 96060]|nr:hypothetical protein NM96060_2228 [Neisseria meningitidis 96060]
MTAAANTLPTKGPRPASSTPAVSMCMMFPVGMVGMPSERCFRRHRADVFISRL